MSASACLTLGGIHLLIWLKQRTAWGSLLFSLSAAATGFIAACELWMMRSVTTAEFGAAVRWLHLPVWVLVLAIVGFVRVYLRAGRPWLAWTVCTLRTLSLVLDFSLAPNLNYREINALRQLSFLGDSISVAEGVPNRWMLIGQASVALLAVFLIDATIVVWRRGDRRQALTLGSSLSLFVLAGTAQSFLIFWDVLHMPTTLTLFYMGIVFAMGYELSGDALRGGQIDGNQQRADEKFQLAVEASPNGIVLVNSDGRIVLVNTEMERLFGWSRGDLIGQEAERLVPERFRGAPELRTMGAGREVFALRKDGTEFPVEIGLSPIQSAEGELFLTVVVDITARKRAEAEALQQRAELAHLSRVTMLGELSGSMAHELNQPLTAILSNAQAAQRFLAQNPPDLDEVREILTDIVDQDKRAGEVIRRLRVLLKKGEVQQQPLDINDVVQDVLKLIRSDLQNQGVAARAALAPDLPAVRGDRVQLQQVLLNLVMNACDAVTGNARADRRVILRTERPDGDVVRVSVSDFGAGIAAAPVEEVFEPFFTTKAQGLGLGLSVCRSIIAAHGGKLWAVNNPERGATFHFTLPVQPEAEP
jgi:PAS domain S-box-containing protein